MGKDKGKPKSSLPISKGIDIKSLDKQNMSIVNQQVQDNAILALNTYVFIAYLRINCLFSNRIIIVL